MAKLNWNKAPKSKPWTERSDGDKRRIERWVNKQTRNGIQAQKDKERLERLKKRREIDRKEKIKENGRVSEILWAETLLQQKAREFIEWRGKNVQPR